MPRGYDSGVTHLNEAVHAYINYIPVFNWLVYHVVKSWLCSRKKCPAGTKCVVQSIWPRCVPGW